ncbi:hypothetical protein HPP92_023102 [Vanilla planifolia]|uniref:RING-type domain-containing protein n=1 Tax=Vanilla planifolia TaxID=51239 RepID=A0A835UE93_VANPL|nr:hypothetical protein HPP92_023102 [Vanilla planifolia]
MAVQAQHLPKTFSPDFRSSALEGLGMLQSRDNHGGLLPSLYQEPLIGEAGDQPMALLYSTVFSDRLQSEITTNVSCTRKRRREVTLPSSLPQLRLANPAAEVSSGGEAAVHSSPLRACDPPAASTTGHREFVPSPVAQELLAQICHHNIEMDAYIRLQNEKLRSEIQEASKQHYRSLFSILEQRVAKRLREKENELQNVNRKNAELEEKVRQMIVENQIWINHAKNNEALVSRLQTSLEHALLQKAAADAVAPPAREGYGDSDGTPLLTEDAQSCSFSVVVASPTRAMPAAVEEEVCGRMACKVCLKNAVCVLVLPCRHLCLCKDCESMIDSCPICNYPKNGCLRIFIA